MIRKTVTLVVAVILFSFNNTPCHVHADTSENSKELIGVWSGKCYYDIYISDATIDITSADSDKKLNIHFSTVGGRYSGTDSKYVAQVDNTKDRICFSFISNRVNELMFCKNGDYLVGNSVSPERKFRNSNFRCPKLVLSARNAGAKEHDNQPKPLVAPELIKESSASAYVGNTQSVTQDVGAAGKRSDDSVPHNASKISIGHQGGTVMPAPEPKTATTVLTESRVALVIGNSKYADVPLRNPAHDAEDLSRILQRFGFNVITRTNVNQRQMEDAVNEFYRLIQNSVVALFYYSGHGTQVQGENYLVPVGENIQSESDVRYKAMNAGYVLGKMEDARTPTNIIILDACRNNPFKGLRSASRGLTMMQAPQGTFIAYATAPNSVAQDGTGRNGVYTKHLLKEIPARGVPIELVFKKILAGVQNETGGQQTPWVATSLKGDFFFNP